MRTTKEIKWNEFPRLRKTMEEVLSKRKQQMNHAINTDDGSMKSKLKIHRARQAYNACLHLGPSTPNGTRLLPKFNGV